MSFSKIAGLLAAAICIAAGLTGSASATSVTAPGGTVYTGAIAAESAGEVVLDNPIAAISCSSTIEVGTSQHGSGVTWKGPATSISQTGCTNGWHVTVISAGSFEIHYISGSFNATVTSNGTTFEATRFGITCRYATTATDIGTITGGLNSTLHLSAGIPFHSGSGLCGSGATTWTGNYEVTTPTSLSFDG